MAKDPLTMTHQEYELHVRAMTFTQLKDQLVSWQKFKTGRVLSEEQQVDVERKETKIWRELMNRKILTNKEAGDFRKWLYQNSHRTKKIF